MESLIPLGCGHGQVAGLYAATMVNKNQMVIFWSRLQKRPQAERGRRSSDAAPPADECGELELDHLYALREAPLEPLMLLLMLQQSTSSATSVVEPCDLPPLCATLWATGGAPTLTPTPTPCPPPYPYPYPYPYP